MPRLLFGLVLVGLLAGCAGAPAGPRMENLACLHAPPPAVLACAPMALGDLPRLNVPN